MSLVHKIFFLNCMWVSKRKLVLSLILFHLSVCTTLNAIYIHFEGRLRENGPKVVPYLFRLNQMCEIHQFFLKMSWEGSVSIFSHKVLEKETSKEIQTANFCLKHDYFFTISTFYLLFYSWKIHFSSISLNKKRRRKAGRMGGNKINSMAFSAREAYNLISV